MSKIERNGPGFHYIVKYRRKDEDPTPDWVKMKISNPMQSEVSLLLLLLYPRASEKDAWKDRPIKPIVAETDGATYHACDQVSNIAIRCCTAHFSHLILSQMTIPNTDTYVPYDIMVIAWNDNGSSKEPDTMQTGWSGEASKFTLE